MAWDGKTERRKSYCPICKHQRAKPKSVRDGADTRVTELECERCGFEWQLEQPIHAGSRHGR
jgi:hypothetical protein